MREVKLLLCECSVRPMRGMVSGFYSHSCLVAWLQCQAHSIISLPCHGPRQLFFCTGGGPRWMADWDEIKCYSRWVLSPSRVRPVAFGEGWCTDGDQWCCATWMDTAGHSIVQLYLQYQLKRAPFCSQGHYGTNISRVCK